VLSLLLAVSLLSACAGAPPMPPSASLLHDEAFAAPSVKIDASEALALSPEMREYAASKLAKAVRASDRKRSLIDALYRKGELRLEYDAAFTRTAAQAFAARSGNCLALVMMTGAFAKELGLAVRYQSVVGEVTWQRAGNVYIAVDHVNLALSDRMFLPGRGSEAEAMTVDFLPPSNAAALYTRPIAEKTVVAMYLNNRAVEALTEGAVDDAYWWVREAIRSDPEMLVAYTTLGVVYRTRQRPDYAEQAFRLVSERDPGNPSALGNRVAALRDLGRVDEAKALQKKLDALEPHPPYSYFNEGMAALKQHRLEDAKRLFSKEVERAPYQSEFQFWLAVTYAEMRDPARAADHLQRAMEMSTTRRDHDLYAAKLNSLKAYGLQ
jgi:Tfp pilus assembly protein PilF